jgi:SAM-dependent methyltransferase
MQKNGPASYRSVSHAAMHPVRLLSERVRWRLRLAQRRLTRPFARSSLVQFEPIDPDYGFGRGLPIDRYYIERFLTEEAANIRGRVLEIDDDTYTQKFGGAQVRQFDILHVDSGHPRATIVADLTNAPHIPSGSFDCLIVIQTLQYIYDVHAALHTMRRILKPGGVALVYVPCIERIFKPAVDNGWGEYWRFTSMSCQRLFADIFGTDDLRVTPYGNLLSATASLHGLAAQDLTQAELDYRDPCLEFGVAVRARKAA